MNFQKITLTVASILLVLFLATIGILLYRSTSDKKFPPEYSECPDYWTVIGKNKCKNEMTGDITNGGNFDKGEVVNFNGYNLKQKCEWANQNNVTWDRINDMACTHFDKIGNN
jgi:hypothetical protein